MENDLPMPKPSTAGDLPRLRKQERRRERRALCDGAAEVAVLYPEMLFRGRILNLSLHGCFIETPAHFHLGKEAKADLRFNLRNRNYKVQAVSRNVQPNLGVGFEFQLSNALMETGIRHLVEELELPQTPLL